MIFDFINVIQLKHSSTINIATVSSKSFLQLILFDPDVLAIQSINHRIKSYFMLSYRYASIDCSTVNTDSRWGHFPSVTVFQ